MKTGGDITRKRLLTTALRLFTQKPYDKVTLKEIENTVGLSRGAIMYHVANKETLFKEAVEMFVFGHNTLTALSESDKASLEKTIKKFVKALAEEQRSCRKEGITNINYAQMNVQMSYYSLFKDSLRTASDWYDNECRIWREVMENAIKSGEIRKIDTDKFAHTFEDTYLGAAYAGLPKSHGYSPERLGEELMAVYELMKK